MAITIDPTVAPATTNFASGDTRLPAKSLGQNDFLKLLAAQYSNQDPLNPKADTDYVAQMATFSNLEATRGMSTDFAMLRASSMLGQLAVVQPENDPLTGAIADPVTGTVSQVLVESGAPTLIINNGRYTLQQVRSVQPATNSGKVPVANSR